MKRILFIAISLFLSVLPICAQAQGTEFETATQAVQNMKIGWNLGNTFDSHKIGMTDVTATETNRGQAVTTAELMEMMKMAGFNAIRVPVTWYPHMDAEGNIDQAWMNRIEEVVNYVLDQGMYCIINVHHDTGKTGNSDENKGWLRATRENYTQNKELFEKIWLQIATRFKNYGQLLLFEGYNEMLDIYDSFNYPTFKRPNGYNTEIAQSAYDAINSYAKSFVETVRATGGNNAHRNLIVSTYAAADARSEGQKNLEPIVKMEKPENGNHIVFEVHTYPPIVDKDNDGNITGLRPMEKIRGQIDYMISNMKTYFVERYGSPVIFGEWGTSNVDANPTDYDARPDYMFQFVDYFVKKTKENGMATFYWMGLSNGSNRGIPQFNQANLAKQILKSYYGDDYQPSLLTKDDHEIQYTVTFTGQWAELELAKGDNLTNDYAGIEVVLAETPSITGNLSFRMYTAGTTYPTNNQPNINSKTNILNFTLNPIQRVTIVWRSDTGTPVLKIDSIHLIKRDGSRESVTPVNKNKCEINVKVTPLYIKSKISNLKYATLYYGDKNLIVPPYVTATAYKVENRQLKAVKTYNSGSIIPAGTGVVLKSEEGTIYKFSMSENSGEAAVGNMLRGSDETTLTTGGDKYYMLSLNSSSDPNSVGFYYGKANGAAFTNGAHKAYLAVPANEAKVANFLFNDNETNGIEMIKTRQEQEIPFNGWYTIDGKLLNSKPTAKGIYISNGKKIVVK